MAVNLYAAFTDPQSIADWRQGLFTSYGSPLAMVGVALLVFPRLALGISGFETGVTVMPLVRGEAGDDPEQPAGRVRNTRSGSNPRSGLRGRPASRKTRVVGRDLDRFR